jgi:gamma-glutamyltranspeptidase/glutathione hydrolase
MTPRSGIVLNDELDDFTKNTWVERFGLTASPNRARPGTRPVSSMTPTVVVRDGHVILAAGGSGGMHIATDVAQSVLGQLSLGGTARSVVAAPRFQIPVFGATLRVREDVGIDFIRDLQSRGEVVDTYQTTFTAVQMLSVMGGIVTAAADPQKHGLALVR